MTWSGTVHSLVLLLSLNSCATPRSTGGAGGESADASVIDAGGSGTTSGDTCSGTVEQFANELARHQSCITDLECAPTQLWDTWYQCAGVNPAWWNENAERWRREIYACIRAHVHRPVCCAVRCISGRCTEFDVKDDRACAARLSCPEGSSCWFPPREHNCWRMEGGGLCLTALDAGTSH